ncbi:MAG: ABC transporter ATP-binding protein [Chloroflexi bacterium]|nr:ABC transporter ATP-binding protein [Chloroflexota bacterium]
MLLKLEHVYAGYGDIPVLWDINLEVGERETVALIGANGSGKTTLLTVISGLIKPRQGEIYFRDRVITARPPKERVRMGIIQIPEGRQLFAGMTVRENLIMGAHARPASEKRAVQKDLEWVLSLFPELQERQSQLAGTLSGGEQQMCAIGRGLMGNPQLLLIDELSLGLAPVIVDRLMQVLRDIFERREMGILLVEQDVQVGLDLGQRGYCLETGHVALEGTCDYLQANEHIQRAYLGM